MNRVVVDVHWKIWSFLVLKLYCVNLLYASYVREEQRKKEGKRPCFFHTLIFFGTAGLIP